VTEELLLAAWCRRPQSAEDTIILVVHDVVLSLNAEEPAAQFKLARDRDDRMTWWFHAKDGWPGNVWWRRIL